ncbi:MAG: hypothetical protein JNM52_05850 [Betaproteobacteria bacterium]|nr:hypothetical protein [Betaproteobacteria bacterium]
MIWPVPALLISATHQASIKPITCYLWALALLSVIVHLDAHAARERPPGWFLRGDCDLSRDYYLDTATLFTGKPSITLTSAGGKGCSNGILMQRFDVGAYRGKRIRFSGFIKSERVTYAFMWLRIQGTMEEELAVDLMEDRPLIGTQEWLPFAIVLDVSNKASTIGLGIGLRGEGQVWMNQLAIESVGPEIATTAKRSSVNKPKPVGIELRP